MRRFLRIARRTILALTALTLLAAIVFLPAPWQADDIQEAVFRYQFAHNGSCLQKNAGAYYLAIGILKRSPSNSFMAEFKGHKPPVRKYSASTGMTTFQIKDRKTGKDGVMFWVIFARRLSWSEVEVKGMYFENGMSAWLNTYRVVHKNGKWTVVKDKLDMVS